MRKVMSTVEVAHAWANQTQEEARSNSLHFRGPSLVSYGMEIARIVTLNGRQVTLFREIGGRSSTTSTHQGIANDASSHHEKIFVPKIETRYDGRARRTVIDHPKVFDSWRWTAKYIAGNLENARKPIKYLDELKRLSDQVAKYAAFFNVRVPNSLLKVLAIKNAEEWAVVDARDRAKAERDKRRRAEKALKDATTELEKWRRFERSYINVRSVFQRDFLRFNKKKERIETSQGVELPLRIARGVYDWMMPLAANGGATSVDFEILGYR